METGKTSRYLKYAIGEIILVVIGILIALQINTWNQNRIDKLERHRIVSNLNGEFKQNKKGLQKIIERYKRSLQESMTMMTFVGVEQSQFAERRVIDSLMDGIFPTVDYIPSTNTIQEIIQSGKLKALNNPKLMDKLSEWQSLIHIGKSREDKIEMWTFGEFLPYLNKKMSWRDAGVSNNYSWSSKGAFETDYRSFLTDLEFENLLENHLFFVNEALRRYIQTERIAENIIGITESYK